MTTNLICESPADHIRVARFLRPDMRPALYDHGDISETSLYKELRTGAIGELHEGGTLILNFGLVDWFPTIFYSLLLKTLEEVRAKRARVVVCCLPPNVKDGFDLMGGARSFPVYTTEAKAIAGAKN